MKYRKLGKTGLSVSEIGHGLWGMGDWKDSNDKESLATLQMSLEMGCNFFDSAWSYGSGRSDRLLGKLIKNNPAARLVAASKIPPRNFKWPASSAYKLKDVYPRQHIMDYAEKILEGIGIEQIDLLQFHVWDDSWTEDDEWQRAVSDLKSKKLIRFFGLSLNRWQPWNGLKAIHTGLIDVVQVIYNIFDQAPEDELFPLCMKLGVGVIARVPLDEGGLSGKLAADMHFPKGDWRAGYFGPENLEPTVVRANSLKELLPKNMSLPEIALRFILANKVVSTTIVGMRSLNHLQEDLRVSDGMDLSGEMITTLRAHRWDRAGTPWSD